MKIYYKKSRTFFSEKNCSRKLHTNISLQALRMRKRNYNLTPSKINCH